MPAFTCRTACLPSLLVALLISTSAASAQQVATTASYATPASAEDLVADVARYRQHIFTLANPFMEGREPSTKGNRIAADYVQFYFDELGLKPAFTGEQDAPTFRQRFPVSNSGIKLLGSQSLSAGDLTFTGGTDFNTLGYSANGSVDGPLVFAGYSIRSGPEDYKSYPDGADLTGKIAMVFRFEPMKEDGTSRFNDDGWSVAANLRPKLTAAISRGAAAVILVSPPGAKDDRADELGDLTMGDVPLRTPVLMMSTQAADRLVRKTDPQGRSLMDLRRLADESGGLIDLSAVNVSLSTEVKREPLMSDNVGAILPGRGDLADQFIVIGAHYDHVGYGKFGSLSSSVGELHPGADDNASGTSALLIAARRLHDAYADLSADAAARSILFLAFGAEESGLIGSAYYANNPITSVENHYLMLNMDMVGRLRDGKLEVGGIATAEGMEDWLDPYWKGLDMKVKTTAVGPPNSDHFSFHSKKIPNIFFFSGFHDQYHRPTDTPDLINCEGAVQIADCCARIALDAAQRREPLVFQAGRPTRPAAPDRPSRGGIAVRFGIAPGDYSGETPGVLIGEVLENLPAQKAGLQQGDLITKWGDAAVDGVETWMGELRKNKPGDKVIVTYVRDGKEATADVTLVGRSGSTSE